MVQYILKRFLLLIPTLVGITFLTFMIMKLAPGDPQMLKLMFASQGLSSEALAAHLSSEKPVIELPEFYKSLSKNTAKKIHGEEWKDSFTHNAFTYVGENSVFYFKWLGNIIKLDFGRSSKDQLPVMQKIKRAVPITILINILTILVIYIVSIPLGIWSALNKGTILDQIVMIKLFVLYSLPGFWVATMLLMFFAGGEFFDLFPLTGFQSENFSDLSLFNKVIDIAWHLFLPVLASTIGGFAFLSRFSRSNFLDVISQDYIRTARAKGLKESIVLSKHAFRNTMIPFVTLFGTLLPGLLGGSVVIEQIFNIPGMGMLSFEAVLGRDHNTIMAIATISAFLTLFSLLLTDLFYGMVDPRIRIQD